MPQCMCTPDGHERKQGGWASESGHWGLREKAELQCRGDERQESAYHLSIGVMFKTGLLSHLHLLLDSPSHSGKGLVRVSSLSTHSVMPMQFTE